MMLSDVCLSDNDAPPKASACNAHVCMVLYCNAAITLGPKSRTEMPRKTKVGTEVAHVTRDSDTTFKVKRSRSLGRGHIVAASHTAC